MMPQGGGGWSPAPALGHPRRKLWSPSTAPLGPVGLVALRCYRIACLVQWQEVDEEHAVPGPVLHDWCLQSFSRLVWT